MTPDIGVSVDNLLLKWTLVSRSRVQNPLDCARSNSKLVWRCLALLVMPWRAGAENLTKFGKKDIFLPRFDDLLEFFNS